MPFQNDGFGVQDPSGGGGGVGQAYVDAADAALQSQIDDLLADLEDYLPLAGGTMTGPQLFGAGSNIQFSADVLPPAGSNYFIHRNSALYSNVPTGSAFGWAINGVTTWAMSVTNGFYTSTPIQFGADSTDLAGSIHFINRNVAGMTLNVPTGDVFSFSINGSGLYSMDASAFSAGTRNIVGGTLQLEAVANPSAATRFIGSGNTANNFEFNVPTGGAYSLKINNVAAFGVNAQIGGTGHFVRLGSAGGNLTSGALANTDFSGTPDGTKFLRDDMTWQAVSVSGYVPLGASIATTANPAGTVRYIATGNDAEDLVHNVPTNGNHIFSVNGSSVFNIAAGVTQTPNEIEITTDTGGLNIVGIGRNSGGLALYTGGGAWIQLMYAGVSQMNVWNDGIHFPANHSAGTAGNYYINRTSGFLNMNVPTAAVHRWSVQGTVVADLGAAAFTLADAINLVFNTTTGTKIGTATTQKLAFYNSTPIVQPNTTGTTTGFTANTSANTVFNESTFTGNTGSTAYTISDVVRALKLLGLMAT